MSLAVFLLWNLMPYSRLEYDAVADREIWVRSGRVITEIWPDIVRDLHRISRATPDFEDWLGIMATLTLIFLALMQFLIAPLWRLLAVSRLLRFIPAGLCLLGFLVVVYFIRDRWITLATSEYFSLVTLSLIALNFLLTTVSLFSYHPEPEPIAAS